MLKIKRRMSEISYSRTRKEDIRQEPTKEYFGIFERFIEYFLVYLVGLIWIIRFRSMNSMKEIASQVEKKTADSFHHFIKDSPW